MQQKSLWQTLFNGLDKVLKFLVIVGNGLMLLIVFGQVVTR